VKACERAGAVFRQFRGDLSTALLRSYPEKDLQMKSRRSQREKGDDSRHGASPIDLMPRNPGEDMFSGEDWTLIAASLRLSARELSVAVLMFEGKTRFQIARKLQCAPGTVRVYIDRLFTKLHVMDRLGLVLRIVRIHLQLRVAPGGPAPSH
jgi:DNA-binding NarL/FixJ family response regulator